MDIDMASEVFKALGDPHRLRALNFLAIATPDCCQGPAGVCACDLVTHLGLAQPTVSHHMRLLTAAGLVTAIKRGRWVEYRLNPERLELVCAVLGQLGMVAMPEAHPARPLVLIQGA